MFIILKNGTLSLSFGFLCSVWSGRLFFVILINQLNSRCIGDLSTSIKRERLTNSYSCNLLKTFM